MWYSGIELNELRERGREKGRQNAQENGKASILNGIEIQYPYMHNNNTYIVYCRLLGIWKSTALFHSCPVGTGGRLGVYQVN